MASDQMQREQLRALKGIENEFRSLNSALKEHAMRIEAFNAQLAERTTAISAEVRRCNEVVSKLQREHPELFEE